MVVTCPTVLSALGHQSAGDRREHSLHHPYMKYRKYISTSWSAALQKDLNSVNQLPADHVEGFK